MVLQGLLHAAGSALNGRRLEDVCEIDRGVRPLGRGTFGIVYRGQMRRSLGGGVVAVKVLDKKKMRDMKVPVAIVESECAFMRECKGHDNFVQLYDLIETQSMYFMVLEFCDGGDLEEAANACKGKLHEREVVHLMRQMLKGLSFLHSKRICHRDVKPQNIMLVGDLTNDNGRMKLADFGIAVRVKHAALLTDKVGTPAFMAPEMHLLPERSSGYDEMVDMWALGCVVVFLLAYEYPFVDGSGRLLQDQLLRGDLPIWDTDVFSSLFKRVQVAAGIRRQMPSRCARTFIRQLLDPRRKTRISAQRALEHDWMRPGVDYEDRGDDVPLLEWKEFEQGIAGIDLDLQKVAAGVVDAANGVAQAVGGVQIESSGCEPPIYVDPSDDRLRSCVVCYNFSGHLGHVCPQCHYTVCLSCTEKLPKSECPHCRHEATDVAATQKVAKFARIMTAQAGAAIEAASEALPTLNIGDPGSPNGASAKRRLTIHAQLEISHACHYCSTTCSALDLKCCRCSTTVCTGCVRSHLAPNTSCPNCNYLEFCNAQTLSLLVHAANLQDSAQNFWTSLVGAGTELFTASASSQKPCAYAEQREAGSGPSHKVRGGSGQPRQVKLPYEAPVTTVIAL